MSRPLLSFLVLTVILAALASSATAGGFVIPDAWEGVWDITTTHRPCGTTGGQVEVESDTLCAGDPIPEPEPGAPEPECTGSVTDTDVDISCSYDLKIDKIPDCTVTLTISIVATRTGETYEATETVEMVYSKECGLPDTCQESVTTGKRTGADPDCEPAPTLRMSWSRIKSTF